MINYVILDGEFAQVAYGSADGLVEDMEEYPFWDFSSIFGILRVDNCELIGTADGKEELLELVGQLPQDDLVIHGESLFALD